MPRGGLMQLVAQGQQAPSFFQIGGNYHDVQEYNIYYYKRRIKDVINGFKIYDSEFLGFEWIEFTKYFDFFNIFNYGYKGISCKNIKFTRLCGFETFVFAKMTHFDCSHNFIKNINKLLYVNKLIWLNCSNNKLTFIPEKIFSLEYFDFSNNYVGEDVNFSLYPNLKYLMASSNKIKYVFDLPTNLKYLDLSNNPIKELKKLPNKLEYLLIVQTRIKSIELLELDNLKYLDLSLNELDTYCLDGLPSSLDYLNCSQTGITKLNNLPSSIGTLICTNNQITSLDMLPENLKVLFCAHNKITKLDDLPNGLKELVCSNNEIIELNNLPNSLKELVCSDDNMIENFIHVDFIKLQKIELNNLPSNLIKLNYKKIELNNLPSNLIKFQLQKN